MDPGSAAEGRPPASSIQGYERGVTREQGESPVMAEPSHQPLLGVLSPAQSLIQEAEIRRCI